MPETIASRATTSPPLAGDASTVTGDKSSGIDVAKAKLKGLLAAAFGSSVTTVRFDIQAPRLTRERRQRKAYGGWADTPAPADDDDGFTRGGITSHNLSVEQTRLQVKQKWETGLFEQRRTGGGTVIKSRLDLGAGLEEGVLFELGIDPFQQLGGGELQDLHGLDHLRRLDKSLFKSQILGVFQAHGCKNLIPRKGGRYTFCRT